MMIKIYDESVEINHNRGLIFLTILMEFLLLVAQDQAKLMLY